MKIRGLIAFVFLGLLVATPSEAAQITVIAEKDWDALTNASGVTYQAFSDTALPTWTHSLTFSPPAESFDSAELELSFAGTRSSTQEVWLLWDSGSVQIGTLNGSGNNSANTITAQTFSVPTTLFPAFPATAWTLQLRLTESNTAANSIFLDYSKLTVTYEDGLTEDVVTIDSPVPAPEPATLSLLGLGLVAVVARHRMKRR